MWPFISEHSKQNFVDRHSIFHILHSMSVQIVSHVRIFTNVLIFTPSVSEVLFWLNCTFFKIHKCKELTILCRTGFLIYLEFNNCIISSTMSNNHEEKTLFHMSGHVQMYPRICWFKFLWRSRDYMNEFINKMSKVCCSFWMRISVRANFAWVIWITAKLCVNHMASSYDAVYLLFLPLQ